MKRQINKWLKEREVLLLALPGCPVGVKAYYVKKAQELKKKAQEAS